jgi:hypothetical protein
MGSSLNQVQTPSPQKYRFAEVVMVMLRDTGIPFSE